ncbi:copper amine oxidase-like protein [Cytobacillus firmus]|uniref:Copper amine oxidase-like protein n=2 Tax=Cytobacillus TaxID=2675230 RepID=A0A366JXW0_CYTFI|nr:MULTISPECIES: stalk domain-containing protein [Cytobacillus]RBP94365.1 copper amine oxidase-like protein [Cytobacillus firmus]TDX43112.1 copper amine oxidase-like protein [Cytobacillus oceanisediminis]
MYQKLYFLTAIMILFSLVYSNQLQAKENKINVYVNGQNVKYDVPPQNIKGRVLVPIRLTSESLNSKVAWFQKEQSATIYDGINTVNLYLNKPFILINGEKKRIDTTPVLITLGFLSPLGF